MIQGSRLFQGVAMVSFLETLEAGKFRGTRGCLAGQAGPSAQHHLHFGYFQAKQLEIIYTSSPHLKLSPVLPWFPAEILAYFFHRHSHAPCCDCRL